MKKLLMFLFIMSLFVLFANSASAHYINLEGGTLAGQPLSDSLWTINVLPNQDITGNVLCEAYGSRSGPGVIVPFGYTWTWGSRSNAIVTLDTNLPQSPSDWNVPINLTAPSDPGTYYILFGARGEYNMQQIFSMTNWATGKVVWNDGNDFHDMDDATLSYAHDHGNAPWTLLTPSGYVASTPGVMPIKVNVVPIPGAIWLLSAGLIGLVGIRRKFKKL